MVYWQHVSFGNSWTRFDSGYPDNLNFELSARIYILTINSRYDAQYKLITHFATLAEMD